MRLAAVFLLNLLIPVAALSQAAAPPSVSATLPPLPTDAKEILAAAAPFYDFNSPTLKPWHMKVSYQLYYDWNKFHEGTYEYWWVSADTYRSTWKLEGVEHTDWYVKGRHLVVETGRPLEAYELKLPMELLSPLPGLNALDPAKIVPERKNLGTDSMGESQGTPHLPCVSLVPRKRPPHPPIPPAAKYPDVTVTKVPVFEFPTYCFDREHPVLRASYSAGAYTVTYDRVSRVQGMFLTRNLKILDNGPVALNASGDEIDDIALDAPELKPDAAAKLVP